MIRLALPMALVVLGGCSREAAESEDWISLFNGRDLTGWTVKIAGHDVGENVNNTFRVQDGLLTVSYDTYVEFDERFGHLFYEYPFSHYRLQLEYRFIGEQQQGGPDWAYRNSGVMLHAQDPMTMTRDQDFPISIEVQFLGSRGIDPRPTGAVCTPGTEVDLGDMLAPDHCMTSRAATYHGDQWVRAEAIVLGDSLITHVINGDTVLQYTRPRVGGGEVHGHDPAAKVDGTPLRAGFIALQSESHPVQFRNIRLLNLTQEGNHDR